MDQSVSIFISYSHQNRFEAKTLTQELARVGYQTWIDFGIPGGDPWREAIEQALQNSLAVLIILTPESIQSEWVMYEIEQAKKYKHTIIPVLFRKCQIPDSLERYQYIDFSKGPDYDILFRTLMLAVTRRMNSLASNQVTSARINLHQSEAYIAPTLLTSPVENLPLERPDGTMRSESLFYVERQGDKILERELSRDGVTVVIKAPRQVGKSSMLVHSLTAAENLGKRVVLLDFQSLDTLNNPELFYQDFCASISDKLGLPNRIDDFWKRGRSNTRACSLYLENYILSEYPKPIVLSIDETDRMFDCPFRSDFFGMLRHWHNSRGASNSPWQRLDMVLVISTEPYMLIENSAQSPFNVGEVIRLEDFSRSHLEDLNERHGKPFSTNELDTLQHLLSGHPYLTRQALYRVAVNQVTTKEILDETVYSSGQGGIFSDHLKRYLSYFNEQPHLRDVMLDIIFQRSVPSEDDFQRLQGAGLVQLYANQKIFPRCKLYYLFFRKRLGGV